MPRLSKAATKTIRRLVDDLVAGEFGAIAADGRMGRVTEEELRRAISDYPGTLRSIPREASESLDGYPSDEVQGQLAVDVPLWTEEKGQSDLTLSVTIAESAGGVSVSIDDLHVL